MDMLLLSKINKIKKSIADLVVGAVADNSVTDVKLISTGIKKTVADQAAQLANMTSQVGAKAPQSALDISNINLNKAMTDIIANASKIANNTSAIISISSGSPKGVYVSLANIIADVNAVKTAIYLTSSDGKWNYWNGTIWVAGGIYQGTSWQEGIDARGGNATLSARLDPMSLDIGYLKQSIAFDSIIGTYPTSGGYIRSSDYGVSLGDPNYVYTDFIVSQPGSIIQYSLHGQTVVSSISFYTTLKAPISGVAFATGIATLTSGTIVAPANTAFVRFCWAARFDGISSYTDNVITISTMMLPRIKSLENQTTNTVDLSTATTNSIGYLGVDGNVLSSTDIHWFYTDFININPFDVITCNIFGHVVVGTVCFYDVTKNFIKSYSATSTTVPLAQTITAPSNGAYVRLSFNTQNIYSATINTTIKDTVIKLNGRVSTLERVIANKVPMPYIYPYKIYTTCNDVISTKKGRNRNYSSAIYLDHFFNGLTQEKNIRFKEGVDRVVFTAPMKVIDSNESNPTITYNNGVNNLDITVNIGITGNDISDSNFNIIHTSTLNSVTKNAIPFVLAIGDSITYAEQATVIDDDNIANWAYHLMCKQFFMMDNIDNGGVGYDCRFLGHYQKTRTMNYNSVNYPVTTYHEGIRGISLSAYLDGTVTDFKSDITSLFSIKAWIAKYRTLDDAGNRLTLGNGTGTLINAGNINSIDVCTPTHITIMLGANGGGTLAQYQQLINIIKTEYPNMIIALVLSDAGGTYFPSLHPNCSKDMTIWNDNGDQGSRHTQQYGVMDMLQKVYGNVASEANNIYMVPFYFVQPTAESCSMRRVNLPDAVVDLTKGNLFNTTYGWHASTHINGIGHINWGYQLYSWLKHTIAKSL